MSQKKPTALHKMQQIANRLISNTPQLAKMLDNDSALKPKKPTSPSNKKNKGVILPNIGGKNDLTANDYHDKCRDLSSQVGMWKEKCAGLEEQINIIKQRFVERQIQYRGIIQQLQEQVKSKSALDSSDRNRMVQINDLHKEILDNIDAIRSKTSKILVQQESDIRRFFNKKITEIKEKFKQDRINKNQKDQEYQQKEKQMVAQLEWIKNIAHKIDQENKTLMKKYSSLKADFEIQDRDKQLLMKELLVKKKQNAALRSQVQQYQKLLNQVSKQMQQPQVEASLLQQRSKLDGSPMLDASRTSKASLTNKGQKSQIDQKRYENTLNHLNKVIAKQRSKIRELKNMYMKQMSNKSQLQQILRKLVQDIRGSIVQVQRGRAGRKQELNAQQRQQLMQRLLANEKVLMLVYDKTFYIGNKQIQDVEMPKDLRKILEDNQQQGFD